VILYQVKKIAPQFLNSKGAEHLISNQTRINRLSCCRI